MTSGPPRSSLKALALAVLAVLAMGGAWLGFDNGGSATDRGAPSSSGSSGGKSAAGDGDLGLKSLLDRFLHGKDDRALDDLLPRGITEISGSGGHGLNRQVRSHGLWFPVFDLSQISGEGAAESGQVKLNRVPLMIVAPHPAPVRAKEWLSHRFAVVGGLPPYVWSVQTEEDAPGFSLDALTGEFSGMAEKPLNVPMNVYVTDAEGMQVSAATMLVIASEDPLSIVTVELPPGEPGQAYTATLNATGGAQPYAWMLTAAPSGWTCHQDTGVITGRFDEPGEHELRVTVSDSLTQVERAFRVVAEGGLEIVNETLLPPAAPAAQYSGQFEATGGTAPYRWTLTGGQIPPGWSLTEAGALAGFAPDAEARFEFQIQVEDSLGLTFQKTFQITVSKGLLVIPSRDKAGLAWQYEAMSAALGTPVAGVSLKRNGVEIYRGQGTNVVDRQLITGMGYSYELTALTPDGRWLPYAAAVTQILPMTRQRGQAGVSGDPFADKVQHFSPLSAGGFGSGSVPGNVTGPPEGSSTFTPAYLPNQLLSLHASSAGGGSIVLEFTDNIVESSAGPDFTVFENVFFKNKDPNQRFMEPATVEVALFEGQWQRFPFRVNVAADGTADLSQPAYYAQGFAGVNASTGEDPTNPSRSGGDSFDVSALGRPDLQWFRFMRLTSTGDRAIRDAAGRLVRHTEENNSINGSGSSGFDLDAVSAVNY
ncbi:hypothetical protein GCM10023213_06990 [Prosthecobacter algae]|uniref:Uncharacterized protein n=1 Tax=Prosthecobacter algae TaxID=1144682 RepID=A0ABP9NUT3_9BACT